MVLLHLSHFVWTRYCNLTRGDRICLTQLLIEFHHICVKIALRLNTYHVLTDSSKRNASSGVGQKRNINQVGMTGLIMTSLFAILPWEYRYFGAFVPIAHILIQFWGLKPIFLENLFQGSPTLTVTFMLYGFFGLQCQFPRPGVRLSIELPSVDMAARDASKSVQMLTLLIGTFYMLHIIKLHSTILYFKKVFFLFFISELTPLSFRRAVSTLWRILFLFHVLLSWFPTVFFSLFCSPRTHQTFDSATQNVPAVFLVDLSLSAEGLHPQFSSCKCNNIRWWNGFQVQVYNYMCPLKMDSAYLRAAILKWFRTPSN